MKFELDADIVYEIVEVVAEKLEVTNLGLEEREALTEVVALVIALYLAKLTPEEPGMLQ